jgi:hypothetical protein
VTGDDVLFEVETPIGFKVRLTAERWDTIRLEKHLEMRDRLADTQLTVEHPDEIRQSSYSSEDFLFYRVEGVRQFVCAIARREDGSAFLVTAYTTRRVKRGELLWPK